MEYETSGSWTQEDVPLLAGSSDIFSTACRNSVASVKAEEALTECSLRRCFLHYC